MISPDEIRRIYDQQLAQQLKAMDGDRVRLLWLPIPMVLCAIICLMSLGIDGWLSWVVLGVGFGGIVYLFALYTRSRKNYYRNFKDKVVREIVRAINPEYHYNSSGYIQPRDYFASGLFVEDYDRYGGDDFVEGRVEKTDFQFSELHTEELVITRSSDGKTRKRWETIFRGIYFLATFNKELGERTVVVPDSANRSIFGHESRRMGSLELVKLENPEFEKVFSVYGSSQQEARYIITPVMMEAMVQIYRLYRRKMSFSFIGANVYCAIPMYRNNFEPKFWRRVKYRDVEAMFFLFSLIETIIREMNLNTRIWTKE